MAVTNSERVDFDGFLLSILDVHQYSASVWHPFKKRAATLKERPSLATLGRHQDKLKAIVFRILRNRQSLAIGRPGRNPDGADVALFARLQVEDDGSLLPVERHFGSTWGESRQSAVRQPLYVHALPP